MKIAVLGATSFIAQELVREWITCQSTHEVHLYARDVNKVAGFIGRLDESSVIAGNFDLSSFPNDHVYDAVINFIGAGDPAKAKAMSASIMSVTEHYDDLVLAYLEQHSDSKYIFLSSGAAYGNDFSQPATQDKPAIFNVNGDISAEKYGLAKFITEIKHRCLPELSIIDVRVFNFFSRYQDLSARFFISDLLRAIKLKQVCQVNPEPMVRDYLHPVDFKQIIECLLNAPRINLAVDCYSAGEIDKLSLLDELKEKFGLNFFLTKKANVVSATGNKINYYSKNNKLSDFGYKPQYTSLEGVLVEVNAILANEQS
ncbi:MAG: NAD-dependent epimerase/dehydratase family protein, partial [Plesiomonas sp.]